MKTAKHKAKSKTNQVQLWLFLLLFTTAFFPLGVKGQSCQFGAGGIFNCSFANPDGINVFTCGSVVTATVSFPGAIERITLTFPNSFEITTQAPNYTLVGTAQPLIMAPKYNYQWD